MSERPPAGKPQGGKKSGGVWGFLKNALSNVSVEVNVGPGSRRAPSGNPTDPAARMEPVRQDRKETYDEMVYRTTDGRDGQAPMVRVDRERQQVARSLDTRSNGGGGAAIPQSGGAQLPRDVRARMEPRLGADLSNVRVGTGGESQQAAAALGAKAFTVGSDVHFGSGQFAPGSKEGDKLLAHELTHVVQGQRSGVQRKATEGPDASHGESATAGAEVSHPDDPAEKEADAVSESVAGDLHGERGAKSRGAGGHGAGAAGARPTEGGAKQPPAQISAKFIGVGNKIHRKTAKQQAEELEQRDGGHSLDRHGPQIADKQLQDRITTGVAPDGKFAPTGVSTKFASHEMYLEARTKSVGALDGALARTRTRLSPLLEALQKAEVEHKAAPAGPDKGSSGKFGKAIVDAKNAVAAGCAIHVAGEAPVKADLGNRSKRIVLNRNYSVVVDHGKPIGSGFEGAGGTKTVHDPTPGSTKSGEGHNATRALASVTKSKATFDTGDLAPALMTAPAADTMAVAQLFPTIEPVGIT